MRKKISKGEQMEQTFNEFLQKGIGESADPTGTFMRLSMQKALQSALEEERTDCLERGYYKHREETSALGRRSGYKPGRFRSAEGAVAVWKPQVRDTEEPFQSRVLEHFTKNTGALLRLVIEGYARGLSQRDVEDEFRDEKGNLLLSRNGVSRMTEELWRGYEAFKQRDLSGYELVYLFMDAVYESMRERAGLKEGILCAWGILRNGKKVMLHLALGNKESYECCIDFIRHMTKRGLKVPLTMTTDGAPGLIKAVRAAFPKSLPIRCWFHGMRNILGKVPEDAHWEVKSHLLAVRDAPTFEAGEARAQDFIRSYQRLFPSAVESFRDDLQARLNHLKLPVEHRKKIRTTNMVERGFEEQRRRTKIIPRFFDEKSCLKLVFAALIRAAQRWRGIRMSYKELQAIDRLSLRLGISKSAQTPLKNPMRLFDLAEKR